MTQQPDSVISDNALKLALENRNLPVTGIETSDKYSRTNQRAVELACADLWIRLVTAPNISEGGFSLTLPDRVEIRDQANAIYRKYNQTTMGGPKATFKQRW